MDYKATIIIPLLHQREDYLERCIVSAINQSVQCEVVVVISPPHTKQSNLDILKKYNLKVEERKEESYASNINTGIFKSSCDRIALLLTDDWLDKTSIEECLVYSTDIVSTGRTLYTEDGKEFTKRIPSIKEFNKLRIEAKAAYLKHLFLFKREKLLEIKGVDSQVGPSGADDYDMIWTLLEHRATVNIIEKSLYNYCDHLGERLTLGNREKMVKGLEKILDKHEIWGTERERIIKNRSRWYGQLVQDVLKRDGRLR